MNVVLPGALRWSTFITSRPLRFSTAPKLDNLFPRIVQRSYTSPTRSIRKSLAIRFTRPQCLSTRQNTFTFPIRTLATETENLHLIITNYKDLPADYNDDAGLDFRNHPLSQKEVIQWFGSGVTVDFANTLLRKLHGRRVAGTLHDPAYTVTDESTRKILQDGLAWLRKNVIVDEIQNEGLRADDELAAMGVPEEDPEEMYKPNYDPLARPVNEYIYKPNSDSSQSLSSSESALDQLREARRKLELQAEEEARKAREDQAEEEAEKAREDQEEDQEVGGKEEPSDIVVQDMHSNVELRRPGEHPWLKYYQKRAREVTPEELPEMTKTERLLPSGLMVIAVVLGSILFAATYYPPTERMWKSIPPPAATVGALIMINSFFLFAWHCPPLWRFMQKNMIVVPGYPRAVSMLGNMWSHMEFLHFIPNMVLLWMIGTRVCDQIGRGDFIAVYLSSGVVASFLSLTFYVTRGVFNTSHLGASGAICGITAAWAWINMDSQPTFSFLPEGWLAPLPKYSSLGILGLIILLELRGMPQLFMIWKPGTKKQAIDILNHLGGYATGIAGGEIIRRKMVEKQENQRGLIMMRLRT